MFGFSSNKAECPVTEEVRQWLEECFTWLIETFGVESIRQRKVLVPDHADFPVEYDGSFKSLSVFAGIVARQMEIDPALIRIDVYIDGQREDALEGKISAGQYFGKQEDGKYHIGVEQRILKNPVNTVATLAHEMAHIKLLGEEKTKYNNEEVTDLTTIIFGLGIFNANTSFAFTGNSNAWSVDSSGYLTQMEWAYALALFAYTRKEEAPEWIEFLNRDIRNDVIKSLNFIRQNPDKLFTPREKKVQQLDPRRKIINNILDHSESRDFESVIEGYKKWIEIDQNDWAPFNNIGYNLIHLKRYEEAMGYLHQAIAISPHEAFPYNNLGYCNLQLGNFKEALANIQKSCEIDPYNSFAWRNLGAYYLATGNAETALEHFESASLIDPDTEMLNFYFAKAYYKLADAKKALEYAKASIEAGELNDSLLDDLEI